jgi:hypothetical protein
MYHHHDRHPDEDEGFDEYYFRRRPKSVCMPQASADGRRFIPSAYAGLPPTAASAHLPPHTLGIPTTDQQLPAHMSSMASLASEDPHHRTMVNKFYFLSCSKIP